ncbi:hypothetical protein HG536_0D01180 [Torulaspora globosa]|uniref:PPIase cyclophilin-type domain-containing protein n=1 Tax=Torulaspora globosa TaxID=48254 RepID=A0A7G3ZGG0_9SACH|nr:uncharacterized protein HG536_0D01180 [Torulaspora globosa]QLL32596.1 hypothetical protein HG536_0D01180 [Torulaspora globosa]
MSEPQASAKVIIHTVKGRINVELWAREKPGHARRFLEACTRGLLTDGSLNEMSRSRDCIMFSKVEDGGNGRQTWSEHNARIRWRTGSVGWDSVRERWFISLVRLSEEDQKVVIGKVVDDSIYTLRKIVDESEIGSDGRLLYPATVRKAEVTIPYFDDLPAAEKVEAADAPKPSLKSGAKVRISFADDEDDDGRPLKPVKRMKIKMPPTISDKLPVEQVSIGDESAVGVPREGSDREGDKAQGSKSLQLERSETPAAHQKVAESAVSSREQETLKLLALFEQKTKDKNILNR